MPVSARQTGGQAFLPVSARQRGMSLPARQECLASCILPTGEDTMCAAITWRGSNVVGRVSQPVQDGLGKPSYMISFVAGLITTPQYDFGPSSPGSRYRRGIGRLAVLFWLSGCIAAAVAEPAGTASGPIAATVQAFIDQQRLSGAVVVVGGRQGILGCDAVGLRDIDAQLPMSKNTIFRIASMTKPITAIGVMILVDEGKLAVEDPVEKYLPEFRGQMLVVERSDDRTVLKQPRRPITVRDLLTHTSGVPAKFPEGVLEVGRTRSLTLAEAIMALSQRPLDFEPGTKWAYCSPGIDALGRIVEVLSGQPFDAFLQQRLFTPLGMSDTTFYPSEEQRGRTAVAYQKKEGKLRAPQNSPSRAPGIVRYPSPAGGLYSTGADMARICLMMLNGGHLDGKRILSAASVRAVTAVQTDVTPAGKTEGLSAGLGWVVVRQPLGWAEMFLPGAFGHGGGIRHPILGQPATGPVRRVHVQPRRPFRHGKLGDARRSPGRRRGGRKRCRSTVGRQEGRPSCLSIRARQECLASSPNSNAWPLRQTTVSGGQFLLSTSREPA